MSRNLLDKWALLQAALIDPDLSTGAAATLGRLLWYLNLKGEREHRCFPSYETLAQDLGWSRRQVMRNVEELEQRGWLTAERRNFGETRAFASNSFRFAFDRASPAPEGEEVVTPMSLGGDVDVTRVVTPVSPEVVTPVSPYIGKIEQGNNNPPAGVASDRIRPADKSNSSLFNDPEQPSPRKAKGPTDAEVENALSLLKTNYPRRPGPKWSVVREKLPAILRRGVTAEMLAGKAREYRDQCARAGTDPQFIQQPTTWINQRGWETDYSPVGQGASPAAPLAVPDHVWRESVRDLRNGGSWPPSLGPAPGQPGCKVPPEILREFPSRKQAAA